MSSCQYVNSTTINSTSVVVCEAPGDSSNCQVYSSLNGTAYTCLSTCSGSYPFIQSAGGLLCVATCSASIYVVNNSLNQCTASCPLPLGIRATYLGSPASYLCSTCSSPLFVSRSTGNCISSCSYVNVTTINTTSVQICETSGSGTCPFYQALNGTAFTCLLSCSSYSVGSQCYSSCPGATPLVASAVNLTCTGYCPNNIYGLNGTAA